MSHDQRSIYAAIKEISPAASVLFYRDEDTLKQLWQLNGNAVDPLCTHLVIVDEGNGSALQFDGMGRHLSALDWAHLYSARPRSTEEDALPQVHVLDLRSKPESGSFEVDRSYLRDLVCYYAPWRGGGVHSLDQFAAQLKNTEAPKNKTLDEQAALEVKRRWLTSLAIADTRAGHHEMNNSLGPLLLAVGDASLQTQVLDAESDDRKKLTKQIMFKAMTWATDTTVPAEVLKPIAWIAPKDCGELRFLLLDDQADEGWVPVLAQLLGLQDVPRGRSAGPFIEVARKSAPSSTLNAAPPPIASLWVATNANDVLDLVCPESLTSNASGGGPWKLGKQLRLTANDNDDGTKVFSEALLLDLRLFAKEPDNEPRFLSEVAKRYKACCTPTATLNWENSLNDRQSSAYLEALACFAKLISEVDFTYPIVMWSSTGQRKVIEALKDHPNIYTGLEKPRLDAYLDHPAEQLHGLLTKAITHAVKVAQASRFLTRLPDEKYWPPTISKLLEPYKQSLPPFNYAELYVDETGKVEKKNLSVGGLLIFYKDQSSAELFDGSLADEWERGDFKITRDKKNDASFADEDSANATEMTQASLSLSFRDPNRLPKQLNFGRGGVIHHSPANDKTNTSLESRLRDRLAQEFMKRLSACGAFPLFVQIDVVDKGLDNIPDHSEHDRSYIYLLNQLLRYVLGVFCGSHIPNLGFFVATRQRVLTFAGANASTTAVAAANSLKNRYGIEPTIDHDKVRFASMNVGTLAPIIFAAESFFAGSKTLPTISVARADTLYYGKGISAFGNPLISRQHRRPMYYADEMLSDLAAYENAGVDSIQIKLSTLDDRDDALGVLESSRHLHKDDMVAAVAALYSVYLRQGNGFFKRNNSAMFVAVHWASQILMHRPSTEARKGLLEAMLSV